MTTFLQFEHPTVGFMTLQVSITGLPDFLALTRKMGPGLVTAHLIAPAAGSERPEIAAAGHLDVESALRFGYLPPPRALRLFVRLDNRAAQRLVRHLVHQRGGDPCET